MPKKESTTVTVSEQESAERLPPDGFPAFRVTAQLNGAAPSRGIVNQLAQEYRPDALRQRSLEAPDEVAVISEIGEEDDGTTEFKVTVYDTCLFPAPDGRLVCLLKQSQDDQAPQPAVLDVHWPSISGISSGTDVSRIDILNDLKLRNQQFHLCEPIALIPLLSSTAPPTPLHGRSAVHPYNLPDNLPQPTFLEARSMTHAISDGRDLRDWAQVDGALAMLHKPAKAALSTRFEPAAALLGWWGEDVTVALLKNHLQNLDFEDVLLFHVALSWALQEVQVLTSLDALISAIGRDKDARRTVATREHWRRKVYRALLTFDSISVIGVRPGHWKEPAPAGSKRAKITPERLYSRDPLIRITGERGVEQYCLDNSQVPREVAFVLGAWVSEYRKNTEVLSFYGNLRAITEIPGGKPSGSWARCIGMGLLQFWREKSTGMASHRGNRKDKPDAKATVLLFPPITRRRLLLDMWRPDDEVSRVLASKNPDRARSYWKQAIAMLKEAGVIASCRELEPLPTGRKEWKYAWLDQPLNIQPMHAEMEASGKILSSAKAARKRGRKDKKAA